MAINPHNVKSPLRRLKGHRPIYYVTDWTLAIGIWDTNRALLIRWNGDTDHPMGNPVSHANPTWFVLPPDLHAVTLSLVLEPNRTSATDWLVGSDPSEWTDPYFD